MTVREVWEWLDVIAPFNTQESYDNAGLLVGAPLAETQRVLFSLDVTLPVVEEAVALGCGLIVSHHPLMFGGVKAIRYDQPEGAALAALAGARLSLIAAHTNWDQAAGGTGDSLAAALGLTNIAPADGNVYLRSGMLPQPQAACDFLQELDARLGSHARMYGNPRERVTRVAVGPGAIGDQYAAAVTDGAQAYVVGEIKHHELLAAQALGIVLYETGHYATEQPGLTALYERFQSDAQKNRWDAQARLTAIKPYDCTVA